MSFQVPRITCLKHCIAGGWRSVMQCVPVLCIRSDWSWRNYFDHCFGHMFQRFQHRDPIFTQTWNFGPRHPLQHRRVVCVCVLHDTVLSQLTGLPEGKQVTSHAAFQNEDNHKQRQRCQCLADGWFINVSSMNWSGVLSGDHWDKTAPVTQKHRHCWWLMMVMPECCNRWVRSNRNSWD